MSSKFLYDSSVGTLAEFAISNFNPKYLAYGFTRIAASLLRNIDIRYFEC